MNIEQTIGKRDMSTLVITAISDTTLRNVIVYSISGGDESGEKRLPIDDVGRAQQPVAGDWLQVT